MQGPLEGIKVLDLSRVLAGPFCTMLLGDMGAEVVKVERKGKGDDSRALPPHVSGESLYFMVLNRNKQSITLNSQRPCYDSIAQAMSGIMGLTGEPDGPPTKTGTFIIDYGAGL
jgi:crotonobetainyl-CoA:carnitine CoA-transferase CaiB-like acyl-CoA transferase